MEKDEQAIKSVVENGIMDTTNIFCVSKFDEKKIDALKDAGFELAKQKIVNEPDRNRVVWECWDESEKTKLTKVNDEYISQLLKIAKALGFSKKESVGIYAKKDKPIVAVFGTTCLGVIAPIAEES